MKPLQNLVVIDINKITEKKSASGLYIPPDKWGEKQNVATVVEMPEHGSYGFKKGDTIVINPYAVLDTPHETHKLIKIEDILAVWQ